MKIELNDVTSGYNLSAINSNFNKIETLFNEKVLFRQVESGETNTLDQNLDCNGKTLYNVGALKANTLEVNGQIVVPDASFVTPIPPVTGQASKFLSNNGTTPYWATYADVAYKGRTLADKLEDFVNASDYANLGDALDTGKSVKLTQSATLSTSDSVRVLPRLNKVFADGDVTLTLAAGTHTTTTGNIANIGSNENISIVGATPVSANVVSVVSVSGSSGAYNVRLQLSSTSGMQVGNYLKLDNMVPLATLSGDNSVYRARVAQNELLNCSALLGTFTCSSGGGSAAWSSVSGVLTDVIQVGDLITQKGQTRQVTTVGSSSVSISGAWTLGTTASRAYYVSRPNSGTVSTGGVSSTTVTGSSSLFLTEANAGDMLLADGVIIPIVSITDNITMTLASPITLTAGTKYSIITTGYAHEGTHLITSIIGNDVIVTNRWKGPYKPPVNRVSGGVAKCIKTVLKNTGSGDGFFFNQNSALNWANNLVIEGSFASSGTHGLAMDGRSPEGPTQIGTISVFNAGDGFSITGWGRGAFLGNGCVMQTRKSHFCGNVDFGVWALEGSVANMRECIVAGNGGRGVQLNASSTLLFTEAHAIGNGSDGVAVETGASIYAEIPVFSQNTGMGIRLTGASGFHFNESVCCGNQASGVIASAASNGELSRTLFAGNARENLEVTESSNIVGNEIYSTGSTGATGTGRGVYCSESVITMNDGAVIGNKGGPMYLYGASSLINAVRSFTKGADNGGINVNGMAKISLTSSKVDAITVGVACFVLADSITPTPSIYGVGRFNEYSSKGSIIKTDSTTEGISFEILKVAGGSGVKKLLTSLNTVSFGTIPAGSSSTQTITVSGAATVDTALVSISNASSLITAGVVIDAAVTAPNTVSIRAQNFTTGAINIPSASIRTTVIGY